MRRTWGPKGQTPLFYHLQRQDRISTISALSVSPKRRHLALYIRFRNRNLKGLDILGFLRQLLKHLRGPLILLWDHGSIHGHRQVKRYLQEHPRVHVEPFPAYAPELNPAEQVWNRADRTLSNMPLEDLDELDAVLRYCVQRMRGSQKLLWSCIYASDLPWKR